MIWGIDGFKILRQSQMSPRQWWPKISPNHHINHPVSGSYHSNHQILGVYRKTFQGGSGPHSVDISGSMGTRFLDAALSRIRPTPWTSIGNPAGVAKCSPTKHVEAYAFDAFDAFGVPSTPATLQGQV